jgi:hypothetical protein
MGPKPMVVNSFAILLSPAINLVSSPALIQLSQGSIKAWNIQEKVVEQGTRNTKYSKHQV